jgi:hypothetical protein
MFIKLISFGLITLLAVVQDIEIRPKLVQGDKFRLEVTRVRRDSSRPQMNASGRTVVDAQVVSAGTNGFVLDWIPGETIFDNPQAMQDPTLAAAVQAGKGMRFRIALGPDGEFDRLLNEAEVRPKLQAMVGTIVSDLANQLPASQRRNFQDMMGQLLSPEALISSATQDAQIYWGLYGAALAAGESISAKLEQPSPMGGGTIPATFRVNMDSATGSTATITTTTTYDKDVLLKMTLDLAERAGASLRPEDVGKMPSMQMADDGKYEFDRAYGLMRKVTINRRITAGNQDRLDSWVITLVETPKR